MNFITIKSEIIPNKVEIYLKESAHMDTCKRFWIATSEGGALKMGMTRKEAEALYDTLMKGEAPITYTVMFSDEQGEIHFMESRETSVKKIKANFNQDAATFMAKYTEREMEYYLREIIVGALSFVHNV